MESTPSTSSSNSPSEMEEETVEYNVVMEEEDTDTNLMKLTDLVYKHGCGVNDRVPLEREFIRPTGLTSDWLNLVAEHLLSQGPFVQNLDRNKMAPYENLLDLVKQIMATFPFNQTVLRDGETVRIETERSDQWFLMGIDPKKHANVIEAMDELSKSIPVEFEKQDGTKCIMEIGHEWISSSPLTVAFIYHTSELVSFH